ncbi:MAG: hypothetical protein ACYCV7_02635 [Acidimicrobiales bacterium]
MTICMVVVTVAVTAVAAARSTWSPCGLSMLATITPLAESGRGNRYRRTATWFVLGSIAGGVVLGACMAALAAGVRALALSPTLVSEVALATSVVAALSDSGVAGAHLPVHHRQVNEEWLDQFRPWVYGAGFGWQVGTGLATYITTAAVYLMIVLASLAADAQLAIVLGTLFGLIRGGSVLLGRHITTSGALRDFHTRFHRLGPRVGRITVVVELAAAATVAWTMPAWIGAGVSVLVAAGLVLELRGHPDPAGT